MRTHVYVIGGAAMVMAYRRSWATLDVDALAIDQREAVLAAAAEVARDLKLNPRWLNEDERTVAKVPVVPDEQAEVLHDSPHLVLTGASSTHLLAMKLHAARRADISDINWLIRHVGARTWAGLEEIHRKVFPDTGIPAGGYERIAGLLNNVQDEDRLRWGRGRRPNEVGLER